MIRLRNLMAILLWLATVSLASYEVVQKSPRTPLGPLPGAELADRADRSVTWSAVTGLAGVDMLLHESREACAYYQGLATGRLGQ